LAKVDELMESNIADIRDQAKLGAAMARAKPEIVFHMAAQPLVRDSYRSRSIPTVSTSWVL